MPSPGDPGLARETQLQREAAEWNPPTKVEDIPLAAEEDIPVIDVGRYLEALNGKVKLGSNSVARWQNLRPHAFHPGTIQRKEGIKFCSVA